MDSSKAFFEQLRMINSVAKSRLPSGFSCTSSPSSKVPAKPDYPVKFPNLILPLPDDCTKDLVSKGYPRDVAQEASNYILRTALNYRAAYEAAHQNRRTDFIQRAKVDPGFASSFQRFLKIIEGRYQDDVSTVRQHTFERLARLRPQLSKTTKCQGKPAFNQDRLADLEAFFNHNAYPSTKDCESLAHKTNMTSQQIRIWFQNHRSRARKNGKSIQRPSLRSSPEQIHIEKTQTGKARYSEPETELVKRLSPRHCTPPANGQLRSDPSTTPCYPSLQIFVTRTPAHAFPSTYPPKHCGYDPFPRLSGHFTFPLPVWNRTPSLTSPSRSTITSHDIDELCGEFVAKLHFRCSVKKSLEGCPEEEIMPWSSGIVTVAPPAPHPALIRIPAQLARQQQSPRSNLPLTPARSCTSKCSTPLSSFDCEPATPSVKCFARDINTRFGAAGSKPNDAGLSQITSEGCTLSPLSAGSLFSVRANPLLSSIPSGPISRARRRSSSSSSSGSSSLISTPVIEEAGLPGIAPGYIHPSTMFEPLDFEERPDLLWILPAVGDTVPKTLADSVISRTIY